MTQQPTTAQTAYTAYAATTNHLNHLGKPMPAWDDLGDTIQAAWTAAAQAVRAEALAEAEQVLRDRAASMLDEDDACWRQDVIDDAAVWEAAAGELRRMTNAA